MGNSMFSLPKELHCCFPFEGICLEIYLRLYRIMGWSNMSKSYRTVMFTEVDFLFYKHIIFYPTNNENQL